MMGENIKLFKNIFEAVYVLNIERYIDENRYIKVLQTLSDNGFKTYHIKDFDRLAVYLKEIHLSKSYAVSILLYLRDENYRKIIDIAKNFGDVKRAINNKKHPNITIVERVHNASKILRKKLEIARAFVKPERVEAIYNNMPGGVSTNRGDTGELTTKFKLDRELVIDEWFYQNRTDIINRLHDLIRHFTIDQLLYMNVEIIAYSTIQKMETITLQEYYNRTIKQVINSLKAWKRICLLYVDVYLGYLEMCFDISNNRDPVLKLQSFQIIVETV